MTSQAVVWLLLLILCSSFAVALRPCSRELAASVCLSRPQPCQTTRRAKPNTPSLYLRFCSFVLLHRFWVIVAASLATYLRPVANALLADDPRSRTAVAMLCFSGACLGRSLASVSVVGRLLLASVSVVGRLLARLPCPVLLCALCACSVLPVAGAVGAENDTPPSPYSVALFAATAAIGSGRLLEQRFRDDSFMDLAVSPRRPLNSPSPPPTPPPAAQHTLVERDLAADFDQLNLEAQRSKSNDFDAKSVSHTDQNHATLFAAFAAVGPGATISWTQRGPKAKASTRYDGKILRIDASACQAQVETAKSVWWVPSGRISYEILAVQPIETDHRGPEASDGDREHNSLLPNLVAPAAPRGRKPPTILPQATAASAEYERESDQRDVLKGHRDAAGRTTQTEGNSWRKLLAAEATSRLRASDATARREQEAARPPRRAAAPRNQPDDAPTQPHLAAPTLTHEESSTLPTRRWLDRRDWVLWQQRVYWAIGAYNDDGPTENNEAALLRLFSLPEKLRITKSASHRQTRQQLSSNDFVPYRGPTPADQQPPGNDLPPETQQEAPPPSTPSPYGPRTQADTNAVKRATFYLTARHRASRRKAARTLHSDMARPELSDEEFVRKLRALHPGLAEPIPAMPPDSAHRVHLTVSAEEALSTFRKLSRAAAPGPSKLTEELMAAACEDEVVAGQIARILRDIIGGRVTNNIRVRLLRCRLIGAGKPGDTAAVRPIAVGDCLMKAAATISISSVSGRVKEKFSGIQFGMLAENGVESIVHEFRDHLVENNEDVIVTLDSTNAFNAARRAAMARELYKDVELSALWRLWDFAYNCEGELVLVVGGITYILPSSEGSRQGDVLGLLSFCLALHPILSHIQLQHPNIKVRAYVDDINFIGKGPDVYAAVREAIPLLAAIGLIVNSKSEVYTHDEVPEDLKPILTLRPRAIKILGCQIGNDDSFIKEWLMAKTVKHQLLFHRLHLMPLLPATILLRDCAVPRMNFLMRTHSPEISAESVAQFDSYVDTLVHKITSSDAPFSEEATCLLALPRRDGGVGIPRLTLIRDSAFHGCRDSLSHCVPENPEAGRSDQQSRTALVNDRLKRQVDSIGETECVHRKACALKHSSLPLSAPHLKVTDREFSAALRWRVGLPVPGTESWHFCPGCNHRFTRNRELQEHLPSCPLISGQNATTTHHGVNHACQKISRLSLIEFWNEPRYREYVPKAEQQEHEQGPDSTYFLHPRPLTVDVKGVGLANITHRSRSFRAVETQRRLRATDLYAEHCANHHEDFSAVVFHYTGGLCPQFAALIKRLAAPAVHSGVLTKDDAFCQVQSAIMVGVGRTLANMAR